MVMKKGRTEGVHRVDCRKSDIRGDLSGKLQERKRCKVGTYLFALLETIW